MIPIYVLTNDKHIHLIEPFAHFWNKYCSLPITVIGFNPPNFNLSHNFTFLSLGEQLPVKQWSNGLIKLCGIAPQRFILMLEDYWLYDFTDNSTLLNLGQTISRNELRIELTGERASFPHKLISQYYNYDIIENLPHAKYQMSFQPSIWYRDNMLEVLRPNEDPWQSEIDGTKRVSKKVIGTIQPIIKMQPVWRSNQKRWQLDKFNEEDRNWITNWLIKQG